MTLFALVRTCAVSLALSLSSMVGAVVTIDQSNLVDPADGALVGSGISTASNNRYGQMQSVTAGKSGTLTRLDLQLFPPTFQPATSFQIQLFGGEPGLEGSLVPAAVKSYAMADIPTTDQVRQGALFSADLSDLGFQVNAGARFTYAVTIAREVENLRGPVVVLGYEAGADAEGFPILFGLEYSGGSNVLLNNNGTREFTIFDRAFRTWVDVAAVPEPATWALMIGGFGVAGAAIRRRRAMVPPATLS